DLDFDLDEMTGGGSRALEHRAEAAGAGDIVVFDQHGIGESEAVVETAAATHGVFFQGTQARRGLAGAADARARTGHAADEFVRRRRYPQKTPEKMEPTPLGGKPRARGPRHDHQFALGRNARAVA